MDILIVGDNNLETVGGEQESTKVILDGIKNKYKVGTLQPGQIKNKDKKIIYFEYGEKNRIKHLIRNPIEFIKYIQWIKKVINSNNPKVIHTQGQVSFFIISILKILNLIEKKSKLIHTERGLFLKYNKFFKIIFFICIKNTDIFITTTQFNKIYWENFIGKNLKLELVQVIENTAGKMFEIYEKEKKCSSKKIRIGFAGRYCEWKNWELAEEIVDSLNQNLNDEFEIKMAVGCLDQKSIEETGKMFNRIKNKIGKNFSGKINIDIKEMNEYYYDLDIFILTSKKNTESFGRTLVEAMSRHNIVLTTDAGGSVEVVGNLKKVCETSSEFVEQILFYRNNSIAMKDEKEKNCNRVKNNYSLENNISKHIIMYNKVLKYSN